MAKKPAETVEQRLSALEREVARLKQMAGLKGGDNGRADDKRDWVDQLAGSMKDFPDVAQVLELGRSIRRTGFSA